MKDGLKNLMCLSADEALSTSVYSSADETKSDDQEVK